MENVYDFGLAGFWYTPNYGAALTTYALAKSIQKKGFSVLLLEAPGTDYAEDSVVYDTDSPVRRFISQYYSISEKKETDYDLQCINDMCDGFISGSDQLWGWCTERYHYAGAYYLLDFVEAEKKKIAYGTSFGKSEFVGNTEDREAFGYLLRRFSDVSVREKDAAIICKDVFGIDAEWVVDPVFLLSKDEYVQLAEKSSIRKKETTENYIFVYLLQPTKEKNRIIKEISKNLGKRIVAVSDLFTDYNVAYQCDEWEFEYYSKLEVVDWIRLLMDSDFVITDSYHGFCFSILFRKLFIALKPRDGLNRFQTIASITELDKRINIGSTKDIDLKHICNIDYDLVWEKISPEIIRSEKWLKEALKKHTNTKEYDVLFDMMRYNNFRIRNEIRGLQSVYEAKFEEQCQKLRKQICNIRRYMVRAFLAGRLAQKHIALRGGGVHSVELLKIIGNTDIHVSCIWDKNMPEGLIEGYPIVKEVSELVNQKVEAILISSWKYRHEMKEDITKEFHEKGITNIMVVDFYEELERQGIPLDSEFFWFDWDDIE